YDPNVHPGISTEFQAAAFRFGHTLVPPGIVTKTIKNGACQDAERDVKAKFTSKPEGGEKTQKVTGIRLCNAYWVPEETVEVENGMDDVIRGLIFTRALKEDNIIVSDLRGKCLMALASL
ncbi:dual oxidase, partial [Biomphalaria glabrata]